MQIIPLSSLIIRKRQRKSIDPAHVRELRESILRPGGLLHPPVCWYDAAATGWVLSVGECRLRAIESIAKDNLSFNCDGEVVPPGYLPILSLMEALSDAEKFEVELVENIQRLALPWQDQTEALAELHRLRESENPRQTPTDTAREVLKSRPNTSASPANAVENLRLKIADALVVSEHLANPKIAKARNAREAKALVYRQLENDALSELASRVPSISEKPPIEIRNADMLELLPTLDSGFVDLILTDPPYGINASTGGFNTRTVVHHDYLDTPEYSRKIQLAILTEGFRITKPRANILMFTDIQHWEWLQNAAANMGWTPFRRPIIWGKSDSEGLAPWGSQGPRITTEFIFFATKGQRGMVASPIDYWRVDRVSRSERIHAAEKPVELLRKAIECTTLTGDFVLDPCCGSGATMIAAKETRRLGLGIEKDLDFFNTARANLFKKEAADA